MSDLRWMSCGGLLADGRGDLATTLSLEEEMQAMVATRLKAAIDGWKLYRIGANLQQFLGASTGINQNTELAIQRACTAALSNQLLPPGSFTVKTLALGKEVEVFVYVGQNLIANTTVTT